MRANKLMIGDWVYSTFCDKPCKVIGIEQYESEYVNVKVTNVTGAKDINSLYFIPLTAGILEKNGFKKHNRYQYIYKDNYCKVCVSFAPRIEVDGMDLGEPPINVSIEGALFDINMSISEIHELQHALRLCGIDKTIEL